MEVLETKLPGLGVRYEFTTTDGEHVGVLVHRDGRREFLVYDSDDPDACSRTVGLGSEESAALVEMLGGSRITEQLGELRHEVEGLSIEWEPVGESSPLAGRTIGDGEIRSRTGASVVAIIRGQQSIPGPGPDFRVETGDTVLLIGSLDAVEAAARMLRGQ